MSIYLNALKQRSLYLFCTLITILNLGSQPNALEVRKSCFSWRSTVLFIVILIPFSPICFHLSPPVACTNLFVVLYTVKSGCDEEDCFMVPALCYPATLHSNNNYVSGRIPENSWC